MPTSTRAYLGRDRAPRRTTAAARYEFDLEWTLPAPGAPAAAARCTSARWAPCSSPAARASLDLVEQACGREVFVSYDANLRETFIDDREQRLARRRVAGRPVHAGQAQRRGRRAARPRLPTPTTSRARCCGGERTELVLLTAAPGRGGVHHERRGERDAPTGRGGRHGGRRRRVHGRPAGGPGRRGRDRCVRRRHARRRGIPDPADRRRRTGGRDHLFPSGGESTDASELPDGWPNGSPGGSPGGSAG